MGIVNDEAEWQRRSDAMYRSSLAYEKMDVLAYWVRLLSELENGVLPTAPPLDPAAKIMVDALSFYHSAAVRTLKTQIDTKTASEKKAKKEAAWFRNELNGVYASASFRIGRFITWLPRKVRGGKRCLEEHGFRYTARRFLEHLTGRA